MLAIWAKGGGFGFYFFLLLLRVARLIFLPTLGCDLAPAVDQVRHSLLLGGWFNAWDGDNLALGKLYQPSSRCVFFFLYLPSRFYCFFIRHRSFFTVCAS